MIKELKYLIYILSIFFFVFFTYRYYFSDEYKKNYYRSLSNHEENVEKLNEKLLILESDTDNIIQYKDTNLDNNEKEYKFWELLKKN